MVAVYRDGSAVRTWPRQVLEDAGEHADSRPYDKPVVQSPVRPILGRRIPQSWLLASDHKILRLCDLCKELGFDSSGAHTVSEGWFGKLRPTLVWCLLCPLASMVPVLWR